MRINVYSQELTSEVLPISKESNTGLEYHAIQFVMHSSPMLHHPPKDDDRSAVTFWLPNSRRGVDAALQMFEKAAELCRQRLKDAVGSPASGKVALSMAETNREKVLRGEVVRVSDGRLVEMQIQAIECEGVTPNPVYHWHWAAALNELVALRKIVAKVAEARGIDLGYSQSDAAVKHKETQTDGGVERD